MAITFNPVATNSPQESFILQTEGYTQGLAFDDPIPFQWIETGTIASTVSGSVYAGMAVTLNVPPINGNGGGPSIILATDVADLNGFVIGNKLYNGIVTPGAEVPVVSSGMSATILKLGTGARIAVACDATLAGNLSGNPINQNVAWDFTNQKLITYISGTALPVKVLSVNNNSKLVTSPTNLTWTVGPVAIIQI